MTETIAVATTPAEAECRPTLVVESPRIFSLIPPGTVPLGDQPHFEVYFNRHPFELLIGQEFVCEMNANVLMMLQQDPVTVADAVSAVGYSYLVGMGNNTSQTLLPVLNRRARILANLRSMKPSSYYFEEALFLLLGLCAMEVSSMLRVGRSHPTVNLGW